MKVLRVRDGRCVESGRHGLLDDLLRVDSSPGTRFRWSETLKNQS